MSEIDVEIPEIVERDDEAVHHIRQALYHIQKFLDICAPPKVMFPDEFYTAEMVEHDLRVIAESVETRYNGGMPTEELSKVHQRRDEWKESQTEED